MAHHKHTHAGTYTHTITHTTTTTTPPRPYALSLPLTHVHTYPPTHPPRSQKKRAQLLIIRAQLVVLFLRYGQVLASGREMCKNVPTFMQPASKRMRIEAEHEVRAWLASLDLEQYYPNFVADGFVQICFSLSLSKIYKRQL